MLPTQRSALELYALVPSWSPDDYAEPLGSSDSALTWNSSEVGRPEGRLQRLGWWLISLALTAVLCLGAVWAWVKLIAQSDEELTRWASVANIVALPLAGLSLIAGVAALLKGRGTESPIQTQPLVGNTVDGSDLKIINKSSASRIVDGPDLYIEMHSGATFNDRRPVENLAPRESVDIDAANQPYRFPHLQTPLTLRVRRITTSGESHEFEFYDSELANKWVSSDPWRSQNADGGLHDE